MHSEAELERKDSKLTEGKSIFVLQRVSLIFQWCVLALNRHYLNGFHLKIFLSIVKFV